MTAKTCISLTLAIIFSWLTSTLLAQPWQLSDQGHFEKNAATVLFTSKVQDGSLTEPNTGGITLFHHGICTAINGNVRLAVGKAAPQLVGQKIEQEAGKVTTFYNYPDHNFEFSIQALAREDEVHLSVHLEKPLPTTLRNQAGLNLEFLPAAYFEKTFMADGQVGLFPLYPGRSTKKRADGSIFSLPIAGGRTLVLAPEDPERRVTIEALMGSLSLFDGRVASPDGRFVVRTFIPAGQTGKVIEWSIKPYVLTDWVRPPVIAHSQVGYHPDQKKVAVIELDKRDVPMPIARLMQVDEDGQAREVLMGAAKPWGLYGLYNYLTFDFSPVKASGLYFIKYGEFRTKPFPIGRLVYDKAWQSTFDAFSLSIGDHYGFGDRRIQMESLPEVLLNLVQVWEDFRLERDEVTFDQTHRYPQVAPDGKPDLLQQIESSASELTIKSAALNYGHIAAVAAASRALRSYNDQLAATCLSTAEKRWLELQSQELEMPRDDVLEQEQIKATIELLLTTRDKKYQEHLKEQWAAIENNFLQYAALICRALPLLDEAHAKKLKSLVVDYKADYDQLVKKNPFRIAVSNNNWMDNGQIIRLAQINALLFKAFPDIMGKEDIFSGLNYIFGCHPFSSTSFVSGVGLISDPVPSGQYEHFPMEGTIKSGLFLPQDHSYEKDEGAQLVELEPEPATIVGIRYLYLVLAVVSL